MNRRLLLVIPLAGLVAAGCASASAKAPADKPALVVPPPPPRVIEPAPEPPVPEPVSDIPPAPSPTPPGRPGRPASREPKTQGNENKTEPKVETKPAEPVIEPVAPPPPQPPPPQLRTPETSDSTGAAKTVRATIDRAKNFLGTVDYGPLSNDRKKAYNDAKLFIVQAEDGLKQGNVVFAQGVATKAETLARELAGK